MKVLHKLLDSLLVKILKCLYRTGCLACKEQFAIIKKKIYNCCIVVLNEISV